MFTHSVLYRQEEYSDKVDFPLTWFLRHTDLTEKKGITDNITDNSTLGFQIFNICTKLRQCYQIYHSAVIQHSPQFQFNDRLPSQVANPLNEKFGIS